MRWSTRLTYTGLLWGLKQWTPKIETRLIDERFESVMVCVIYWDVIELCIDDILGCCKLGMSVKVPWSVSGLVPKKYVMFRKTTSMLRTQRLMMMFKKPGIDVKSWTVRAREKEEKDVRDTRRGWWRVRSDSKKKNTVIVKEDIYGLVLPDSPGRTHNPVWWFFKKYGCKKNEDHLDDDNLYLSTQTICMLCYQHEDKGRV
jgi:hypothetical protein